MIILTKNPPLPAKDQGQRKSSLLLRTRHGRGLIQRNYTAGNTRTIQGSRHSPLWGVSDGGSNTG
jgi:hypothetical protein